MSSRNSQGTNIEPGIVSRIAQGLRYALTGNAPDGWFGPMEPIAPALDTAPAEQAGVAGRQFDYRTGYNVSTKPRANEAISFEQLRALAENLDLMRLVIETRKDQICALQWSVVPKAEGDKPDNRCKDAELFLRSPDKEHEWDEWLRMLLEDLFVIDAPTLYIRKTKGGDLYSLEPIDGATIKRVIDATGRTPQDGPAYQQVLKGVPAVDYTREELIYKPRNVRTHKVYGFSPVEQVINTVNIALRRQLFTLNYFTEGTVPDALAGVPDDWSVQQINEFQVYWDTLLSDDMAGRRKLKFVPGEIARNFHEVKQPPLKDMFDEWLARVICYAFSIDATPFVAQVNRAVAETTREQSLSEGLAPTKQWVKSLVDRLLLLMGYTDLHFMWVDETTVDPFVRSQIDAIYLQAKVITRDEVRADLGLDPLTPEQKAELDAPAQQMQDDPENPPEPSVPAFKPDKEPSEPKQAAATVEKKKIKQPPPIDRERQAIQDVVADATTVFTDGLASIAPGIIEQIVDAFDAIGKDDKGSQEDQAKANKIADDLDLSSFDDLREEAERIYRDAAKSGAEEALNGLGITDETIWKTADKNVVQWAKQQSASMVGKRWENGKLIDNPDAKWRISESTREMLRKDIQAAMQSGTPTKDLSKQLQESYAFSKQRAETIARTEVANSDISGSVIGWKDSGVVEGKEFDAAVGCCPTCDAMNGEVVGLEDAFSQGNLATAHPRCRCNVLPVLMDQPNPA